MVSYNAISILRDTMVLLSNICTCCTVPGHFGPKPFQPGTPQPKSFVFTGAPRTSVTYQIVTNINEVDCVGEDC